MWGGGGERRGVRGVRGEGMERVVCVCVCACVCVCVCVCV